MHVPGVSGAELPNVLFPELEIRRLRPETGSGPEFRPGRDFCGAELREPGSCQAQARRPQCIAYRLQIFARCLKDAGQVRCRAHQISRGARLGFSLALRRRFFFHFPAIISEVVEERKTRYTPALDGREAGKYVKQ